LKVNLIFQINTNSTSGFSFEKVFIYELLIGSGAESMLPTGISLLHGGMGYWALGWSFMFFVADGCDGFLFLITLFLSHTFLTIWMPPLASVGAPLSQSRRKYLSSVAPKQSSAQQKFIARQRLD